MISEQKKQLPLESACLDPQDAFENLASMIDGRSKQLSLKIMSLNERGMSFEAELLRVRLNELKAQKEELKTLTSIAKDTGCQLDFTLKLEINLVR